MSKGKSGTKKPKQKQKKTTSQKKGNKTAVPSKRRSHRDSGKRPRSREVVTGTFQGHERGFGFVVTDKQGLPDVFIPPLKKGDVLHGDRVEALVTERGRDGRLAGHIVRVIERSQEPIVGVYDGRVVIPRDPRMEAWIRVHPADAGDAEPEDMVVVEITKWPSGKKGAHGKIIEVLGEEGDPDIESHIVLRKNGFTEEFPDEVIKETQSVPQKVRDEDRAGREDLTDVFTITIDPERARDFDDALSIQTTSKGYRAWVSIADVSHYVRPGSALDEEAYARATSVYLPDRSVPMLPPELSSGICSLRPAETRLAVTVEMNFDFEGVRREFRIYPSVICSDHRLTYEEVEEMEHDTSVRDKYPGAWPVIENLQKLAKLRQDRRTARGAIDLDIDEAEVVLDDDGEVVTIARRENTWSHRLVEEYMLTANEAVATYMAEKELPVIRRIHEGPFPASVEALADQIAPLGFQLLEKGADPENIKPADYQRIIKEAEGGPYERLIKTLSLRSMMQARYSHKLIGHFGLASECYCHFTSPIRRYPDLVVHRLVKQAIEGGDPGKYAKPAHLSTTAEHCSERERAAEAVEREMVDLYSARWMARHLGEEFDGVVSGVTPSGIFVELDSVLIEGMVPLQSFKEELVFREEEMALTGPESEYRIGDRVRVQAKDADIEKRRTTFWIV